MKVDLSTFDWNAVGAIVSMISALLAVVAVVYAYRQVGQWKAVRVEQAKAIAPALTAEFKACSKELSDNSRALAIAVSRDPVSSLPERSRSFKATRVQLIERFVDKLDCFGANGPLLTHAAAAVLSANARLDILAHCRAVGGVLEPISDEARATADYMRVAALESERAWQALEHVIGH